MSSSDQFAPYNLSYFGRLVIPASSRADAVAGMWQPEILENRGDESCTAVPPRSAVPSIARVGSPIPIALTARRPIR
jgi:hypothetical protein